MHDFQRKAEAMARKILKDNGYILAEEALANERERIESTLRQLSRQLSKKLANETDPERVDAILSKAFASLKLAPLAKRRKRGSK